MKLIKNWVEPVQHVEGAVAKESDVNIVTQSYQPQAVAKECGKKYFSFCIEKFRWNSWWILLLPMMAW